MKNVPSHCVCTTTDRIITFSENNKRINFHNPSSKPYKKVKVDGCAITSGCRCDDLLVSTDEVEEHYVELKGVDVKHAIDQLEHTITALGTCTANRHAYVISTNVAPAITSAIQKKKTYFKQKFNSNLLVHSRTWDVQL